MFPNAEEELLASLQMGRGREGGKKKLFKGQEEEVEQHEKHCPYWKSLLEINQTFIEHTTS